MSKLKIPQAMQALFWSTDYNSLDLSKHMGYIVTQVLIYGSLADIQWLFSIYGKKAVCQYFLKNPSKNYPAKTFDFVKNYVLGLDKEQLDEQDYVTSIFGRIRPRTAKSIS